MKPKYSRYLRKALPDLIVIPAMAAMLPSVAEATIYPTLDPFGNVVMNDASLNGANTFIASGGSSLTPTVTVSSVVYLTGDANATSVLSITGNRTYTVTVASGAGFVGGNHTGISSTIAFSLVNSGTIDGNGIDARRGIDTVGNGTSITNNASGIIEGNDSAIRFSTSGGIVINEGQIRAVLTEAKEDKKSGFTTITGKGIGILDESKTGSGLTVTNIANGTITGSKTGIEAKGALVVMNGANATIQGTDEHGIKVDGSGNITNYGLIIGGKNGIDGKDSLVVINYGNATIQGTSDNGIKADKNGNIITNSGLIVGGKTGIDGKENLVVINNANATIQGGKDHGIKAEKAGNITNTGLIVGGKNGIESKEELTVLNNLGAQIIGSETGIVIEKKTNTITSAGWIGQAFADGNGALLSPGVSIDAYGKDGKDSGTNTINLNTGSVLWGDVLGGKNTDTINMDGGWLSYSDWISSVVADSFDDFKSSNLIAGNVTGIETLNKTGEGLGLLIGNDHAIGQINVTGGALYINTSEGNSLGGVNGGNTTIIVGIESWVPEMTVIEDENPGDDEMSPPVVEATPFTQIGGTGLWNANIELVGANSVISAGGIPIQFHSVLDEMDDDIDDGYDGGDEELAPVSVFATSMPSILPLSAVGEVIINGNVSHSTGSFIRFDVIPGFEISNGINSDLITLIGSSVYDLGAFQQKSQTPGGSVVTVGGAGLIISPTNNNLAITNGEYIVVDSEQQIEGFNPDMPILIQFNPNINESDYDSEFIGSEVPGSMPGNMTLFAVQQTGPYVSDDTVLGQYFITPSLGGNGTDLVFEVDHKFASLPGLDANQSALGAALDAASDDYSDDNEFTQDLISALDYSSLLFVQDTLDSLVPDASLAQASAVASSNYGLHRRVQNHLSAVRDGGGEVIETPASTDAKGGMIPAQTTTSCGGRGNVWGAFSYDWKDSEFDTNLDGEDASFIAGVDYRVTPNLLLGVLLEGSQADYDYTGGSSDVDSLRVATYGTYGGATGFYSDFLLGYGNHDLDSSSALGGILFGNSAGTSTEADSLQALLTVGYNMETNGIKHGPFAGFEYQNVDVDGYTTTGVFPVAVDGYDVDSLRFLIGYRAEATYGKFTPFASLAYAHEFEDGPISATASLPGGAAFGVTGGGLDSAILLSIGTGYSITSNLDLNVSYNGEFSTGDGVDSNGGSIGLNYSF